ncbi:MAG: hypothetical protein IKX51_07835, partial [Bacteroidales bacterium]|nr:hypothetical protein [Bacteroidales bacterium]
MLSRHFLRAKVLQTLYSCNSSDNNDIAVVEKNFVHNIEGLNRLGINMMYSLVHMRNFAANFIEEGKQKYIPSQEDKCPNMRFVENAFIAQIANNVDFQRHCTNMNVNFADYDNVFRKLYGSIRESDRYKKYMSAPETDYENDKKFAIDVFKVVANDKNLIDI